MPPVCPLCGSAESAALFTENDCLLRACAACELLFIDPYPADAAARHATVRDYSYEHLKMLDRERFYRAERLYLGLWWPEIRPFVAEAASVLDVGCGCGRLLELLAEAGVPRRAGIELNRDRAAMARDVAGCTVHEMPVEQFTSDEPFDAVCLVNVLSHIPSFDALFASLRRLLRPGGNLVLKVGEVKRGVRRNDLYNWGLPDHLHFLGLRTLEVLCDTYGFDLDVHRRIPFSDELFSRAFWRQPGRSTLRNVLKTVAVHTPGALRVLRGLYRLRHDERIYSTLAVLRPRA